MNKKQLMIAALATVLSITVASATDITGVVGNNGVYNINPEKINGDVGYRQYTNFNLSEGDIANLIYQGYKNGTLRDLGTFINLVNNKVNINGILNAVKADGTGHAVFISPNGMAVGSSGVLNVGTLSVITPKTDAYNALTADYAVNNFENINQINKMRNGDNRVPAINNYGGNGEVKIDGYVFTRNGADIRGSKVDVNGGIVNGYKVNENFTAGNFDGQASAAALFNTLVNTNGISASASKIVSNGTSVVIKSGAGEDNYLKVTGKVANMANGETVLTNHGDQGLTLNGAVVAGNGKVNIYNNNAASALTASNGARANAHKGDLSVTSKGGMDLKAGTNFNANKNLEVVNKGDAMALNGALYAGDRVDIVNSGANGATVNGTIGSGSSKPNTVRIVNEKGKLTFAATANANKSVSIRNTETANGADVNGVINAGEGVLVHNEKGNLNLNGKINVAKGVVVDEDTENVAVAIYNQGNGKLSTGTASEITVNEGNIAIKNAGTNGMKLQGKLTNEKGVTAINNMAGAMDVTGTIANNGNMGIRNNGTGAMTVNADITNQGDLNIANIKGESFTVKNKVANTNGNVKLYNYNGDFEIDGSVTNENGDLFVASRGNSQGLTTSEDSNIQNYNGDLAIKHNGTGTNDMGRGLDLNGTVIELGDGELAINNYKGDMHVGGGIVAMDAKTGIVNRAGGEEMTVDATIVSSQNKELRIKNEAGTGDMTVAGDITHDGRLNILNNSGSLTLDGKITNTGSDRTYAILRDPNGGNTLRDGGIEVTQNFNAQSTDGMIYILNKVGEDGLTYKGTAKATNAQAELYSRAGDMTVNGGSFEGKPTIILNKGDKLTVTNAASVTGATVKIVNKGTGKEIGSNHNKNYYEQLKK